MLNLYKITVLKIFYKSIEALHFFEVVSQNILVNEDTK